MNDDEEIEPEVELAEETDDDDEEAVEQMTEETEVRFTWSITLDYTYAGRIGDLPDALRDALVGESSDDDTLHDKLTGHEALVSYELREQSDTDDETLGAVTEAFLIN